MLNLKTISKAWRKQPQPIYNISEDSQPQETSDDPTLPNPRPHSETEHLVPSSKNRSQLSSFSLFPDGVEVLHRLHRRHSRYLLCPRIDWESRQHLDRQWTVHSLAQDAASVEAQKSAHTHVWLRCIYSTKICCIVKSLDRSCYEPSSRFDK